MKTAGTATKVASGDQSQISSAGLLYRNPHLLTAPLIEGFLFVKNPLLRGAEQVINPLQAEVLSSIDPSAIPEQIAARLGLEGELISQILKVLSINDFVRTDAVFPLPQPPPLSRSLSLWIHTSNRCNLACSYCYVNAEKMGALMSEDVLAQLSTKIVQVVKQRGVKSVQLKIAGGEPLITFNRWSRKIEELKRSLEAEGASVNLQIVTNGTVFSDAVISFIREHRVGLGLSMDGYGSDHDKTRHFHNGAGSFSLVLKNLQFFRENGVDPYITVVVTPESLDGLQSLTRFFVEENLRFRFSLEKQSSFHLERLIEVLGQCYSLVEQSLPTYRQFLSHTLCDLSFERPIADSPCGVGRSRASVNVNGDLHACQVQHTRAPLGVIAEERDFLEIIQNPESRRALLAISDSCEECRYRYICGGGCPVAKVANKSPFCLAFHALLPKILRIRGLTILYGLAAQVTGGQRSYPS